MKPIISIVFLLLPFMEAFSQLPPQSSGSRVSTGSNIHVFDRERFSLSSIKSDSKVLTYDNIEGSAYIDNNTTGNNKLPIGKFYSPEMEYLDTALARYNAYTDKIEVSLLEDGVDYYLFLKKPDFLYITLGKNTYRAYEHEGSIGFFVIISNSDKGVCTLLKKERVVFRKAEKASSSFVTDIPDSFKRVRDVYYFKFDNLLKEIPRKKKSFYKLFGAQKNEIKSYIESNRLKINREVDLLKISGYYNSLMTGI